MPFNPFDPASRRSSANTDGGAPDIFSPNDPNGTATQRSYANILRGEQMQAATAATEQKRAAAEAVRLAKRDPLADAMTAVNQRRTNLRLQQGDLKNQLHSFVSTEGVDLFESDPISKKPIKNPDGSFVPKMGAEIDALKAKTQQKTGLIGSMLSSRKEGDPTDEAAAAQKRLAEIEPAYQLKMQKFQRIQGQIKGLSDADQAHQGELADLARQREARFSVTPQDVAGAVQSVNATRAMQGQAAVKPNEVDAPIPGDRAQAEAVKPSAYPKGVYSLVLDPGTGQPTGGRAIAAEAIDAQAKTQSVKLNVPASAARTLELARLTEDGVTHVGDQPLTEVAPTPDAVNEAKLAITVGRIKSEIDKIDSVTGQNATLGAASRDRLLKQREVYANLLEKKLATPEYAALGTINPELKPDADGNITFGAPAKLTPRVLVQLHQQMQANEETMGMDTTAPELRAALQQQNEMTNARFMQGMAALPSDGLRQRVVDLTRDPTLWEKTKNFVGRIGEGIGSTTTDTGESVLRNASKLVQLTTPRDSAVNKSMVEFQSGVKDFAEAMREEAAGWGSDGVPKEVLEKMSGSLSGSVGQGIGSTVAFMAPTVIIGGVGKLAGLSEKAIGRLMFATVAASGAASESNNFRREAEMYLKPDLEAGKITQAEFDRSLGMAELFGAAAGSTEAFTGISRMAKRIGSGPVGKSFLRSLFDVAGKQGAAGAIKWMRGAGAKAAVDVGSEMLEEMAQEYLQNRAENIYASKTFDPTRPAGWLEDGSASEAAGSAAVSTLLVSTLTQAFRLPRSTARYKALGEAVNRGAEDRRNQGGQNGQPPGAAPGAPVTPPAVPASPAPQPTPPNAPIVTPTPPAQAPVADTGDETTLDQQPVKTFEVTNAKGQTATVETARESEIPGKLPEGFGPIKGIKQVQRVAPSAPADTSKAGMEPGQAETSAPPAATPAPASLTPGGVQPGQAVRGSSEAVDVPPAPVSTEAKELIDSIDSGGAAPAFISKRLEKIAADNGIAITGDMRPEDVIAAIRKKINPASTPPSPQPAATSVQPQKPTTPTPAPAPAATPSAPPQFTRRKIPFSRKEQSDYGQPVRTVTGESDIIDVAGRHVVLVDVNGVQVPFYLSTGHGGKKTVTSGKWYPFFGINGDWFNKGSEAQINDYYGSAALKAAAEHLDATLGDTRARTDVQKAGRTGPHIDAINTGLTPTENETKESKANLEGNINDVISRIERSSGLPAKPLVAPSATPPAPKAPPSAAKAPAVARGTNKPATFIKAVAQASGIKDKDKATRFLQDFAPRLHRANPKAFEDMEVHVLNQAEWNAHPNTGAQTPDSAAAYNPETNTLYFNSDKMKANDGADAISAVVHEAGHFAEKFALGEEFTQREWLKLKPEQRIAAWNQYTGGDRSIQPDRGLQYDKRARAEWVAMQFARVVRGETEQMAPSMLAKLKAHLEMVRELVRKWIGDKSLTTKGLDAKILEMLGEPYTEKAQAGPKRKGEVGGMLESGEVVTTSSGRETTPFPKIATDTDRKATATIRRVDAWLLENAIAEAESRNDRFNLTWMRNERADNLPPASKDSLEEYLFGQQPKVLPPVLKPMTPTPAAVTKPAGEGATATTITPPAPKPAPVAKPETPTPASESKPAQSKADALAAARAKAKASFDLLGTPSEPDKQVGFPDEHLNKFVDLAKSYIAAEIKTPDALARELAETIGPKARKYTRALWKIMEGQDSTLPDDKHDWNAIYAVIDKPAQKEDVLPRESDTPTADATAPVEPARPEGAGDSGVVAGEQPDASEGMGDGRDATGEGAGSSQPGSGSDDASAGGGSESPSSTRDLPDIRRPRVESVTPQNYRISEADRIGEGGLKAKFRDNIAAIKQLKGILKSGRAATIGDKVVLARYVGWGGLKSTFDPTSPSYSQELAELLTKEEYEAARASVLNAHYTSPTVVQRGVYAALARFGFRGGKMIEGGVGIGHFIGMMPDSMVNGTSYVGVEKDPITASIAQLLYPEAKIHSMGFEEANLAPGSFDAAAGNPPFGETKLFDKNFPAAAKFSIHNYFILKQLELLRPGGVAGFVVSHYFLDAKNPAAREAIAKQADFLGAIRLPNTAFKQNANTEVTTDIVFFRKRAPEGDLVTSRPWVNTVQVSDKASGEPITINQWLKSNPEMMLGEMTLAGKMYAGGNREATLTPRANQDLGADLDTAVAKLPENVYRATDAATKERLTSSESSVPAGTRVGAYFVDDKGALRRRLPDYDMKPQDQVVEMPEGSATRIKGMIEVRDAMNRLVRAEMANDATDAKLAELRKRLNKRYDAFVEAHGYLNNQTNRRLFYDDPEAARLLGLEKDFDPGVSKAAAKSAAKRIAEAKTPEEVENASRYSTTAREPSAAKAAIFTKRVNQPYAEVTSAGTPKEALAVSLNQRGEADIDYMAQLTGQEPKAIIDALKGLVFATPQGGYQSKEQYLSGNVRDKLKQAQQAFEQTNDPQWKDNIDALTAVIPKDVSAVDIAVPVGAPWVPASDVAEFAQALTGARPSAVLYRKSDGGWLFNHDDRSVGSTETWGTKKAYFEDLMRDSLNGRPTIITYKDEDGKTHVDAEATALAAAKSEEIKTKWAEWIFADQERRDRLARFYNDNFNNYVDPNYDGSHLTLPGMSTQITLLRHQKSVIWRTITDRNVLYDHVVGAGKTFAGVASFMELKRMGRVRKPLFIVPNHLTNQWRDAFVQLYPNANVLAAGAADFGKDSRQKLFAKILTGEYDAVIIGHSQAKKIGVNPEVERSLLNEMIAEITETIEAMKKAEGKRGTRAVAQAEKTKERLTAKLKALAETGERDGVATFDELGIDGLFVDEAHEFKNLFYTTQMQRVAGLGNPAGSQKAFDLYMKTRYMKKQFAGKAPVVFATGTPISNSLVEMFTMQRYLQPEVLEQMGLKTLDAWAKVFASVEHVYEVDPTGTGYRMATRLASFQNVGELAATYRTVADVITSADLQSHAAAEGKRFPTPKVKGGKPQNIVATRTPDQEAYFGVAKPVMDSWQKYGHASEAEAISKGWVPNQPTFDSDGNPVENYPPGTILYRIDNMPSDARIDNMLKLTSDARKAGLDMRLVDPAMPDRPESKINRAVADIARIHSQWADDKGTQLVFCDLSVPASARGKATSKAKEQAGEFFFVRGANGNITPVDDAKPVKLEAAPKHTFFVRKSDNGSWIVTERSSGKTVGGADTKTAAILKANEIIIRVGESTFAENVAKLVAPLEEVTAARDAWMETQRTQETEAEATEDSAPAEGEAEAGVSLDELLADQSTFSVYDDMKAKLVKAGIPEKQIAFIHDYDTPEKKAKLFAAVNRGDVRVLFGSTPKMGAGTNVQKRIVALHHMDAPWRPSDLEQREGRAIRQGNMLYERSLASYPTPADYDADPNAFAVEINRYATNQTYDTRMWQLIEHKARGIEGFRKADRTTRKIEDVSGEAANASDMKAAASGDPAIQREMELRNERNKLELLKKAWNRNRFELQSSVQWMEGAEGRHASAVDEIQRQIAQRKPKPDPFEFTTADGTKLEKKEGVAQVVASAIKEANGKSASLKRADIGQYRGYKLLVEMTGFSDDKRASVYIRLPSKEGRTAQWKNITNYDKTDTISDVGFMQRVDNVLDGFENEIDFADRTLAAEQRRRDESKAELAKGFPKEGELAELQKEHDAARSALLTKKKKPAPKPEKPEDGETMGTPGEQSVVDPSNPTAQQWKAVTLDELSVRQRNDVRSFEAVINRGRKDGEPFVRLAVHGLENGALQLRSGAAGTGGGQGVLRVVRALEQTFGKRILFVKPSSPVAWGALASPELANAILVNIERDNPMLALIGHELGHNIQAQRPDLWNKLAQLVEGFSPKPEGYDALKESQGYKTPEARNAEWVNDVFGSRMDEPDFWRELKKAADAKQATDPTTWSGFNFQELLRTADAWLSKMGLRFRNLLKREAHADFIPQIDALRSGIADVLATYQKEMPEGGYPENPEMEKKSKETDLLGTPATAQRISSADTSLQQVPALFKSPVFVPNGTNLDIGAGKYDLGKNYLEQERGVSESVPFDPYNRASESNRAAVERLQSGERFGTVTVPNVLNVIAESGSRANVIRQAARALEKGGTAFFQIYEGDGSGAGRETSKGFQNNRKTADYVAEVKRYFGTVERRGNIIVADAPANVAETPWMLSGDGPALLGTPPVQGTPAQEAVLSKVNGTLEDKRTLTEKFRDYLADLKDYVATELKQKLLDSFASIKRLERATYGNQANIDASASAYKAARLTKNLPSVMDYLMKQGQIEYRNGGFAMKGGAKGLMQILKPLIDSGKVRLWEGYVTAFRANRLLAEGKESNFGRTLDPVTGQWSWDAVKAQQEINELLALAQQHPELETVRQGYADFQKGILDVAESAGLIDPAARALWEKSDYVPFYRIAESLDGAKGPRRKNGIADQRSGIKQLKGGAAPVAIMENIVRNVEQMIDASFKNVAMQRVADLATNNTDMLVRIPYKSVPFKASVAEVMDTLEKAGIDTTNLALTPDELMEFVKFWRMKAPKGKDVVSVMVGGKPIYYRVKDAALLRSVQSMGPRNHSWWMNVLMAPKQVLTVAVTLDPAFMAANTIRDSFSAWVVSDTPLRPGLDAAKGFLKALRNDPSKLAIMAAGGGSGHYNNLQGGRVRDYIRQLTPAARKSFLASIIDTPAKAARLYMDVGRATENANRIAIADSVRKYGGTDSEAAFQALDIMDFGLRGDSTALNFFLDVVPFLNARIQGLYRLGRGLKEDPRRVATHGAIITGATMALLASNWDDDKYWALPEWERDVYYHFWVGGQHIRIPKPFEVGQIFSTVPERMFEFMGKTGDGKLLAKRMLSMVGDTFAMNPLPQIIKPAAERAMNLNTFTGGRIISRGDEFKQPEQQFSANTSESLRELAKAMPDAAPDWMRSPRTLEHFARGYFGSLGMYALTAGDALTRAAGNYPEDPAMKTGDFWVMKRFAPSSDTKETKYVSQFYDLHQEITGLMHQIKELQKNEPAQARELAAQSADLLRYASRSDSAYKVMQGLRKEEAGVFGSNATPEEKRDQLAGIAERRNRTAQTAMQASPRAARPWFNPFSAGK
jgi:N12 class adenine-specific DNA methylase